MTPGMFRKWQREMRKYGLTLVRCLDSQEHYVLAKGDAVDSIFRFDYMVEACREAILRHGRGD